MNSPGPDTPVSVSTPVQAPHADAIQHLLDRPVTAADLAAGTELASRPAQAGRAGTTRLLLFRIGEEAAALPVRLLRRVTPLARATPIPHRSGGVLRGVCNIRGELVLCADLRQLLGLPARDDSTAPPDASSDPRRMVVIGPADNSWAFEVDELIGVESVDPATVRASPLTVAHAVAAFASGVTEIDRRCTTVLDGERILAGFKAGLA